MCTKGVGWEPISDIVDRLVEELASRGATPEPCNLTGPPVCWPGTPLTDSPAGWAGHHYRYWRDAACVTRHSAEAEPNGLAVGSGGGEPTATAQTVGGRTTGRAHTTLAGATGVVIGTRGSRAVDWVGGSARLLDDGRETGGCLSTRKPGSARHGIALGAKR